MKMPSPELPPLVVILGPTAVGKTAAALALATAFEGEIVSADSRLLYRGMDVGTAKPSQAELAAVPHHLIDVADPSDTWSLADYQGAAYTAIDSIHAQDMTPFLVGGTGQYIRAITEGWKIPERAPQQGLRAAIEDWGVQIGPRVLHARLARLDSAAAQAIEPNNLRRTVRAFEVIFSTGIRFSEQSRRGVARYSVLKVGLMRPRSLLYGRIDARIDRMLADGWLQEVDALLGAGHHPTSSAMSAIGYKQLAGYLQGEYSFDEAVVEIRRITRTFVRRQANWFKPTDPEIQWFDADVDLAALQVCIDEFLS